MPTSLEPIYVNLNPPTTDTPVARLSYKERVQIKTLRDLVGMSYDDIKNAVSQSRTTIRRICNEPATPKKNNGGFRRVFDTPAKDRLINFIESSAIGRRMTFGELAKHHGLSVSATTIARYLKKAGFRRSLAVPKPWLTDKHKMDRLDWALEHGHWDAIDWARVIWTDESAIQNGGTKRLFVTRRPGEQFLPDCLRPRFAKPAYTMVWGAIVDNRTGPLLVWDKEAWGNITSDSFVEHIVPVSLSILAYSDSLTDFSLDTL